MFPLLAFSIAVGAFLTILNNRPTISLGPVWDLSIAYFIAFASYSAHELGHASALRYAGARPGRIGFTMYLLFPAFYSDVTDAWRLSSKQRVVVDLAGSFFECCLLLPIALALAVTHYLCFRYAILMMGASVISNLNPVFRFDGYWVLRDYFGTANVFSLVARASRTSGSPVKRIGASLISYLVCGIWIAYAAVLFIEFRNLIVASVGWLLLHMPLIVH